jgi:ubiquinone/menaquinone biosynthesis C-methylase UbiE
MMNAREGLSPDLIAELVSGYQRSRILLTAYELGIFTAIGDEKKTSREVALLIKADLRGTDRLMNALCALGLFDKKEELFSNRPLTARFLVEGKPEYMTNLMHANNQWRKWSTLTEAVRCGTSVSPASDRGKSEDWPHSYISAMHWRGGLLAAEFVSKIDLTGVSRMLDVGGGSGVYAMAMVRAKEDMEAVVFDLPDVIALTRRFIEEAGLTNRMKTVEGDFEKDDFGSGFDLVLFSAILHMNSPLINKELLDKARRALNPGGLVVISDFILDEDRTTPVRGAIFAINMLVSTEAGDSYTEGELREWMKASGFDDIERKDLTSGHNLLMGRKSSG